MIKIMIEGIDYESFKKDLVKDIVNAISIPLNTDKKEIYLDKRQTAKHLHVCFTTVYKYVKQGKLHPRKINRKLLFKLSEVEEVLNKEFLKIN
jgi:predicted site-specific integrase-resolvase